VPQWIGTAIRGRSSLSASAARPASRWPGGSVGPQPTMAKAVDAAAAMLIAAGGSYGIEGALEVLETWVSAKIQPGSMVNLHSASSALTARGRALVACLAVAHRLCSAASVARYFCRAKATLSEQMTACRARLGDRHIVETPIRRILEEAAALQAMGCPANRRRVPSLPDRE